MELIVGGGSVVLRQHRSHNVNLLLQGGRRPSRPDLKISITEMTADSFSSGNDTKPSGSCRGSDSPGKYIRIVFNDVGAGVSLFLPLNVFLHTPDNVTSGRLRLIGCDEHGNPDPSKTRLATTVNELWGILFRKDKALALYEVVQSDDNMIETAQIDVFISFIANTAQNLPGVGQSTVSVGFLEGPTVTRNVLAIVAYSSSLLFPFVSNQGGLDTKLIIANTSLDPFGTSTQQGSVTLSFYGDTGQEFKSYASSPIQPGGQLVFTLSSGGNHGLPPLPGFQGYVIATSRFQYAYGIAFINDCASKGGGQIYKAVRLRRDRNPGR